MKTWTIKFEIFGKKMMTKIDAYSKKEAEEKLRDKIIIYSCDVEKNINDLDFLKNIFNIK